VQTVPITPKAAKRLTFLIHAAYKAVNIAKLLEVTVYLVKIRRSLKEKTTVDTIPFKIYNKDNVHERSAF